jgi:hypothetical protein
LTSATLKVFLATIFEFEWLKKKFKKKTPLKRRTAALAGVMLAE